MLKRVFNRILIAVLVVGTAVVAYFHFTGASGRPVTTPDGRTLIAAYQAPDDWCRRDTMTWCPQYYLSFYDDGSYSLTRLFGKGGTATSDGRLTTGEQTQLADALKQVSIDRTHDSTCAPEAGRIQETVSIVTAGQRKDYPVCAYTVSAYGTLVALLKELAPPTVG